MTKVYVLLTGRTEKQILELTSSSTFQTKIWTGKWALIALRHRMDTTTIIAFRKQPGDV